MILVDTGILVAAAERSDTRHAAAVEVLQRPEEKIVTDAILSETHHLIAARVSFSVANAFLLSVDQDLIVEPSTGADRQRARELCQTYQDARLDYTDALTIAVCERLGITVLATLDRRHFDLVRLTGDALQLIP